VYNEFGLEEQFHSYQNSFFVVGYSDIFQCGIWHFGCRLYRTKLLSRILLFSRCRVLLRTFLKGQFKCIFPSCFWQTNYGDNKTLNWNQDCFTHDSTHSTHQCCQLLHEIFSAVKRRTSISVDRALSTYCHYCRFVLGLCIWTPCR